MKTPLGTEVDLGPGHIVLDGVPAPAKGAQQPLPLFGPCLIWPRSPIAATAELLFEFSTHRGTHGHPHKLLFPDPRVNVRAHCFPSRVISLWNRLPASVVSAENVHVLKKLLTHVDFSYATFGNV